MNQLLEGDIRAVATLSIALIVPDVRAELVAGVGDARTGAQVASGIVSVVNLGGNEAQLSTG
jgi:hypothetical protein